MRPKLKPHERIILAYDTSAYSDKDIKFFLKMQGLVGGIKLGLEAFSAVSPGNSISVGNRLSPVIRDFGYFLMADWKLKDIPNTVGRAVHNIAHSGAWGVTVHADGGSDMIAAAMRNRFCTNIIGVTVLTSITPEACQAMYGRTPASQVTYLASLLVESGAQAIVSSPLELEAIQHECGDKLVRITPGIRHADAPPDDQKRTMTFYEAIKAGADYCVIGRPILQADDPVAATKAFVEEAARADGTHSMV